MSCRLWVMLILIILQMNIAITAFDYLENCFYEKRSNTSLHGYNDRYDRWTSDFDCFTRCLTGDSEQCRSFEHWHHHHYGLCIRANISLTDSPSNTGRNQFVDYYEINCREGSQVIRPSKIDCPDNRLFLTVMIDDIDPKEISLGNDNCKPIWANDTHAKFISHIDNCSLILTNDSILGKLRWQDSSMTNFERFFTCRSELYQRRLTSTLSNRISNHDDEQRVTSAYKMTLEWTLHNQSYYCPNSCFLSLYSLVNITLGNLSLISTKFLIDSCDLIALPPYTNYLQSRRLIHQGCSVDPTVISVPKTSPSSSIFHFSFYLYHILKEPIPFEIQCKILHHPEQTKFQHNIDCSYDINHHSNNKRDHSYTLLRSLAIYVTRQLPPIEHQDSIISIATVQYIQCSLPAFFLLLLFLI